MLENEKKDIKLTVQLHNKDFQLTCLPRSIQIDMLLSKRVVIERSFYGAEYIDSIRLVGDRYFMSVDDEEYELFGEPTSFEYWLLNENKGEPSETKILEDGAWVLPEIEKGVYVIGRTNKRMNFHEVTPDQMILLATGPTDDIHIEYNVDEWEE